MSFLRLAQDYDTLAYDRTLTPVAYLGFCEGGQSQRREVRGTGGANGVECGEGVSPPPLKKGSGEGRGLCPLPRNFLYFFWFNVFVKFLRSGQRGGIAHCPLNTPLTHTVVRECCTL